MSIKILNKGGLSWSMFLKIKDAALDTNGVIFGGAVRDQISHNAAADTFYEKVAAGLYEESQYNDYFIDPETRDRFILPQDIDAVFYSKSDLKKFKEALKRNDLFVVNETTPSVPSRYFSAFPDGWLHSKWTVRIKMPRILCSYTYLSDIPTYDVDVLFPDPSTSVVVNNRMLPPFGVPDFECNSLAIVKPHGQEIITIDNKCLSYAGTSGLSRHAMVERIIKDIINKQARFIGNGTMDYRIRKMMYKNFTVSSTLVHVHCSDVGRVPLPITSAADTPINNTATDKESQDDDGKDLCLICLEDVNDDFVGIGCCKGKYHPGCLKEVVNMCDVCPQCRSGFYADACDKHLLTSLANLFLNPTAVIKPFDAGILDEVEN